ncbi:hypothetical protein NDU88_002284 [Pleurodeles waltl]|uniref:Uncharacterized protein n=1 Tax=Pleurodeles waltl TaxID=8319 RepID=A0AAV7VE28_PLEWA|nr:hypothetical protein NDU88_002284 [Pleurodeles waltl]
MKTPVLRYRKSRESSLRLTINRPSAVELSSVTIRQAVGERPSSCKKGEGLGTLCVGKLAADPSVEGRKDLLYVVIDILILLLLLRPIVRCKEGKCETRHGAQNGSGAHQTSALSSAGVVAGVAMGAAAAATSGELPPGPLIPDTEEKEAEEVLRCRGCRRCHRCGHYTEGTGAGCTHWKKWGNKGVKGAAATNRLRDCKMRPPSSHWLVHIKEAERKLKGIERHRGTEARRRMEMH